MTLARHTLPEERRPKLKRLIEAGHPLRFMEAHNPLSALTASSAVAAGADGKARRFDGLWLSGFSMATSRALPDIELARFERRLESIEECLAVTDLPVIADADTGGEPKAFQYLCARLEALGVSGVVVEDKRFPKRTSLATGIAHRLEDVDIFLAKIDAAKSVLRSPDFLIFARTEALIAGAGMKEAVDRAEAFLRSSADGILIHSKDKTGAEVLEFAARHARACAVAGPRKPLLAVPTAYPHLTEGALNAAGISLVIYGNHQIRAAHAAMIAACESILAHGRAQEIGAAISPVATLIEDIGAGD